MADRAAIERALTELDALLETDDADEAHFQSWFERHPVALSAYGYVRVLPHPVLRRDDESYIPDFIGEGTDGIWEIVELKRPDTKVVKNTDRRTTFYSNLESYIAQCRDYARCFTERRFREEFNTQNAVLIQEVVNSVLVAGRRRDLDLHEVHRLLVDERGGRVRLQTYDDVRARLEFYRAQQFAMHETLPGWSVHLVLSLGKLTNRDNFILDFGAHVDCDRISLYVDPHDRLCFRVLSDDGTAFTTRVALDQALVMYGVPAYVVLELGLAQDYSYMAVEVNGRYFADRRLDKLSLSEAPLRHFVMGSDVTGQAHTEMRMFEQFIADGTITFSEKQRLREYVFDRYEEMFAGGAQTHASVNFSGNQFLHSTSHPNFCT